MTRGKRIAITVAAFFALPALTAIIAAIMYGLFVLLGPAGPALALLLLTSALVAAGAWCKTWDYR